MVEYQLPKLNTRVRFPFLAPFVRARSSARFFRLVLQGLLLYYALLCCGCATAPTHPPIRTVLKGRGVYHTVQKGETLWRISKVYQAGIDDIVKVNKIPQAATIEKGQRIFIPGAMEVKKVKLPSEDPNKDEFAWPVRGEVLRYYHGPQAHYLNKGIVIKAKPGQSVEAARQGKVVFSDYLKGYRYTVILDHLDGYYSVYSQNSELMVNLGDFIFKGDTIAKVSNDRDDPFLYFEIRKGAVADNPLYYLPKL